MGLGLGMFGLHKRSNLGQVGSMQPDFGQRITLPHEMFAGFGSLPH